MAPSFEPFTRFADDLAKMATGAAGAAASLRSEMTALMRQRLDGMLESMDLVAREDYQALQDMVSKLREEQEALLKRVAALEAAQAPVAAAPAAPRKTKVKVPEAAVSEVALEAAAPPKPKRPRKPKAAPSE